MPESSLFFRTELSDAVHGESQELPVAAEGHCFDWFFRRRKIGTQPPAVQVPKLHAGLPRSAPLVERDSCLAVGAEFQLLGDPDLQTCCFPLLASERVPLTDLLLTCGNNRLTVPSAGHIDDGG